MFKILQKDKNHHSSTYNNAPMPYMNRLTWSGVALHAGQLPGYPASHGCVRLPKEFAELLFGVTKIGMTVVIADDTSQPEEVTHPGMVLGEYAAREFNAVDTAIKATEYSEGHERAPKSPSVVVSSADKSIKVFDNGALAPPARSRFRIRRSRWASGCSRSQARTTSQARWLAGRGHRSSSADDWRRQWRGSAPHQGRPATREAVRKRLKFGMTIVTTDQPADAKTRSGDGFVVLDSQS